jgi:ZIP family zinc transporter
MQHALSSALTFVLIPSAVALVSAALAAFREPSARIRSYIEHFAAGIVAAVAAVELLPEVIKDRSPVAIAIGFGLGTAAIQATE